MPEPFLLLHKTRWKIQLIQSQIPPYWIPILTQGGLTPRMRREWPLVLEALGIPHWLTKSRNRPILIIPCLVERLARCQLSEYESESPNQKKSVVLLPVSKGYASLSCLLLIPVCIIYTLRFSLQPTTFSTLGLPTDQWTAIFGLDNTRIRLFHEWYRCVTALFLHSDIQHITSNIIFSTLFLHLLAKVTGPGHAMLLTIAGGILGNAADVFAHRQPVLSIGFSTAIFASIGALSGITSLHSKNQALLPLAAGAALLAILGTEGENTDYTSHLCGLLAGMSLGSGSSVLLKKFPFLLHGLWQGISAMMAILLPAICFLLSPF